MFARVLTGAMSISVERSGIYLLFGIWLAGATVVVFDLPRCRCSSVIEHELGDMPDSSERRQNAEFCILRVSPRLRNCRFRPDRCFFLDQMIVGHEGTLVDFGLLGIPIPISCMYCLP